MKVKLDFNYNEEYLPTKRHKIPKIREVEDSVEVCIPELLKSDVKLAFTVKEYATDQNGNFRYCTRHYYSYEDSLYTRTFAGDFVSRDTGYATKLKLKNYVKCWSNRIYAFGKHRTKDFCLKVIRENTSGFIIIGGNVYHKIREPRYCINTFGLGFNHGGTCISIEHNYNDNISKNRYFNALEKEKAFSEFKRIALGRGDTKSVKGTKCLIIVLDKKFVKCNPQEEHGEGDTLINAFERIIADCNSVDEAAISVVSKAASEM